MSNFSGTGNLENGDLIDGGAGSDSLTGGSADDTIIGGQARDTINAGAGDDVVYDDNIDFSTGSIASEDVVDLGAGDDVFIGTGRGLGDQDTIFGGAGNDTINVRQSFGTVFGGDGDDVITSEDEDPTFGDFLSGGAGNDTITGANTDDTIVGGDGDDLLSGRENTDTLEGGAGNDTLEGGADDDLLTGGEGDDTFIYAAGDGDDTITDFNTGNSGTLSDGISTNNDSIDLSAFYDYVWELHADQADDGVLNQSNDGVDGVDYANNASFGSGSLTFTGASADNTSFTNENTGVVCFASGTAIRTPAGEVLVETLRAGDLVTAHDHGPSKVLWIGCTEVVLQEGQVDPGRTPVRIKPDAASGERALLVSPQHCLMMTDATGQNVLVRARHLAEETQLAAFARGRSMVTYWHVLLEQHSVLISQGRPSESSYPGPHEMAMMAATERTRLLNALPALRTAPVEAAYGPRTLKVLTRSEVRSSAQAGAFAFASPHEPVLPEPTEYRSQVVA